MNEKAMSFWDMWHVHHIREHVLALNRQGLDIIQFVVTGQINVLHASVVYDAPLITGKHDYLEKAVKHGQLETLRWYVTHHCKLRVCAWQPKGHTGKPIMTGPMINEPVCELAAEFGQIHILAAYYSAFPDDWNERIIYVAVKNNHLDTLKWLYENPNLTYFRAYCRKMVARYGDKKMQALIVYSDLN